MTGGRIAEAGVYPDIDIADYVDDPCEQPSLSSSLATILIDRSPAHAKLRHPHFAMQAAEKFSDVANFGSAVHSLVFGGPEIVTVEANDWKTKDARKARDAALDADKIPLLEDDIWRADQCAARAREVVALLNRGDKASNEDTLIWQEHGVWLRCRPDQHVDLRTFIDLKVTQTNPADANRQFFNQGYDMQSVFFERGADSLDHPGRGRRRIYYLFVEAHPPFQARALPISEPTLMIARKRFIAACNIWRECLANDDWSTGPLLLPPSERPSWQESQWLTREMTDETIQVEDAAQ